MSLAPEAVKLPGNMIIHKLGDEEERVLVGRHAGCSSAQIEHIGLMKTGETVVLISREGAPKNVMMFLLEHMLQAPLLKKGLTPEQVHKVMKPVFAANPHLCEIQKLPSKVLEKFENNKHLSEQSPVESTEVTGLVKIESSDGMSDRKLKPTLEHFIRDVVNTFDFANMFFERLRLAANGDVIPIVNMISLMARKLNPTETELWTVAHRMLELARSELGATEDEKIWNLILDTVRAELTT
jgi:hypothetical protein